MTSGSINLQLEGVGLKPRFYQLDLVSVTVRRPLGQEMVKDARVAAVPKGKARAPRPRRARAPRNPIAPRLIFLLCRHQPLE